MAEFHGQLSLRAEARADGSTVLAQQAFRAPFHLSKPYFDHDTRTLLVQVVNPTAGILSGDRLESAVTVAADAAVLLTTPSASRLFRMRDGEARSTQTFHVERGGWLEVLPEPLVPHAGSVFTQHTALHVAAGAAAFYADLLQPGRVAHGEAWAWSRLVLALDVRVGEALILHERFDQAGADLRALAQLAGAGEAACFGNAVLLTPDAALAAASSLAASAATLAKPSSFATSSTSSAGSTPAPAWREALHALHTDGVWIGASALRANAGWSIKFVAPDGVRLRQTLKDIRRILAPTFPHLACDARKL